MWFYSWEAVRRFPGEDYERAYVPAKARAVLARFDERSQHYKIRAHLEYEERRTRVSGASVVLLRPGSEHMRRLRAIGADGRPIPGSTIERFHAACGRRRMPVRERALVGMRFPPPNQAPIPA